MIPIALALTGCVTSTGSSEPPRIEAINAALTKACGRPVHIPERDLNGSEISRLWAQDRGELATCANRQKALAEAIEDRDRRLTSTRR